MEFTKNHRVCEVCGRDREYYQMGFDGENCTRWYECGHIEIIRIGKVIVRLSIEVKDGIFSQGEE